MSDDLDRALAAIWRRSVPVMRERLQRVAAAVAGVQAGALTDEVRDEGVRAAHQLSGSLGSFGMPEGSDAARALETELRGEPDAEHVADLSRRLHEILLPRL